MSADISSVAAFKSEIWMLNEDGAVKHFFVYVNQGKVFSTETTYAPEFAADRLRSTQSDFVVGAYKPGETDVFTLCKKFEASTSVLGYFPVNGKLAQTVVKSYLNGFKV